MATAAKRRRPRREKHHCISESTLRQVIAVFRDCLHARYQGKPADPHDELVEALQLLEEEMR